MKHGRESRDFKTTTMADTIEKTDDSCKTVFDISVNTGQICMGFKVEKWQQQAHCRRLSDKDLVKKFLSESAVARNNFFNQIFVRKLLRWTRCFHFPEYLLQTPYKSDQ